MRYATLQLLLGAGVYAAVHVVDHWVGWLAALLLVALSLAYSLFVLHQKTSLWSALTMKFRKRFRHG